MDGRLTPVGGHVLLAVFLAACGPSITPGLAPAGTIGYGCDSPTDCTKVGSALCLQMPGGPGEIART